MRQFIRQTLSKTRNLAAGTSTRGQATPLPTESRSFAAVAIQPGLIACDAVSQLGRRRMLEKDAPALPVPGCDESRCRCRYVKFADRRAGEDRRTPFGNSHLDRFGTSHPDKRDRTDRRVVSESKRRTKPRAYFNNYD